MNDVTENKVAEENVAVMSDTSTIERKIESIVFNTLKSKVKGHIYVKMKEKTEDEIDTLYINIDSNSVVYNDQLKLPGDTFDMVSQNSKFAETLAYMIIDNYKKYLDYKFFFQDTPKKYNKNTRYRKPETREN